MSEFNDWLQFVLGRHPNITPNEAAEMAWSNRQSVIDALIEENSSLASWQCLYLDGSGLTGDDYGNQTCLKARAIDAHNKRMDRQCNQVPQHLCRPDPKSSVLVLCEICPKRYKIEE